jgi:hypothetical protein
VIEAPDSKGAIFQAKLSWPNTIVGAMYQYAGERPHTAVVQFIDMVGKKPKRENEKK